jgi:hypothetical protein
MISYLIEYNGKVIGSYSDYTTAEIFILSCYQNNLMNKNAYIHCYKINSCYQISTNIITPTNTNNDIPLHSLTPVSTIMSGASPPSLPQTVSDDAPSISSKSDDNNNELISEITTDIQQKETITPEMKLQNEKMISNIEKEKHDLIHNMNLLKVQQNKITEVKQVFEVDLKLFNQFKSTKETDNNFVIPELFVNKYKIMNNLFLKDKLDWSNYYNEMKNNKDNDIYDEHFITNSYENSFINNKKSDKTNKIDEELYLDI